MKIRESLRNHWSEQSSMEKAGYVLATLEALAIISAIRRVVDSRHRKPAHNTEGEV